MDSCPLSLLIDVRALRCISALKDAPMLVCICPLCKKYPASPTSCTIQPEHIDYTAHGGRIKAGRNIFFWLTCLIKENISHSGKITYCRWFFIGLFHSLQKQLKARKIERARQKRQEGREPACHKSLTVQSTKSSSTSLLLCFNYAVSLNSCYLIQPGGYQWINGKIQLYIKFSLCLIKLATFSSRWHRAVKRKLRFGILV